MDTNSLEAEHCPLSLTLSLQGTEGTSQLQQINYSRPLAQPKPAVVPLAGLYSQPIQPS